MTTRIFFLLSSLILAEGTALPTVEAGDKPPVVSVSLPVAREVIDFETFTGRTEAAASVELRARASGFLTKVLFKEGSLIKQGDLLFELDNRLYQAQADVAKAKVVQCEAGLRLAHAINMRFQDLAKRDPNVVSRHELDKNQAAEEEAIAILHLAKANLEIAKLNLDFTKVTAPISGRIGRSRIDPGNLVKADETILATLISQDRMSVAFDMDERTFLRLRKAGQEDKLKVKEWQVTLGLADETDFPRKGTIDFVDNQLDPKTGTLRVRAAVANPDKLLLPGLFVRVRLGTSIPYKALLVPERALAGNNSGRNMNPSLLVVNDKNVIEARPVTLGTRFDGMVIVKGGLKAEDRVVVDGLKGLQAGMSVQPRLVSVPK